MALDENPLHDVAPLASSSLSGSQIEFRLMEPHPMGLSCSRAHGYVIERHLLPRAPIPGSFFSTDWQIASASDAEAHAAAGDPPGWQGHHRLGGVLEKMALDENPLHNVAPLSSSSLSGGARATPRPAPVALPFLCWRTLVRIVRA